MRTKELKSKLTLTVKTRNKTISNIFESNWMEREAYDFMG
jgi:NADH:ubiquinone oxidoreductase subunit C